MDLRGRANPSAVLRWRFGYSLQLRNQAFRTVLRAFIADLQRRIG